MAKNKGKKRNNSTPGASGSQSKPKSGENIDNNNSKYAIHYQKISAKHKKSYEEKLLPDAIDYKVLGDEYPEMTEILEPCPPGSKFKFTVDYTDPMVLKILCQTLFHKFFKVNWRLPAQYLCPSVPRSASIMRSIADLMANEAGGKLRGSAVAGVDLGIGANCVLSLIGASSYNWTMVGLDCDDALTHSKAIAKMNPKLSLDLREQKDLRRCINGVIQDQERLCFLVCNPPFHETMEFAKASLVNKQKRLGTLGSQDAF